MKLSSRILLRTFFLCAFSFFFFQNQTFAQADGDFAFQGVEISIPENVASVDFNKLNTKSGYDNTIYAWMQFNEVHRGNIFRDRDFNSLKSEITTCLRKRLILENEETESTQEKSAQKDSA